MEDPTVNSTALSKAPLAPTKMELRKEKLRYCNDY